MRKKEKIIYISIAVFILILSTVSITYALWTVNFTQEEVNVIETACFNISFKDGDAINLTNTYPIPERAGLTSTPYTITVTNNCPNTPVTYSIYLTKTNTGLDDSYIKVGVNESGMKLTNYSKTNNKYLIKAGVLPGNGSESIDIKAWIDKEATEIQTENKTATYQISGEGVANAYMLDYQIIANNAVKSENPNFANGCPLNSSDQCSGLYKTQDDLGDSYYFRGKVDNNYVKLSATDSNTWRIVRINGDGTIRLVLDGDTGTKIAFNSTNSAKKYVGYTYDNKSNCTGGDPCISNYSGGSFTNVNSKMGSPSTIKSELEKWYSNIKSYDNKIALTTYCNDTSYGSGENNPDNTSSYTYFGAYQRVMGLTTPILTCPDPMGNYGGVYKLKIGLLSADEVMMAGFTYTNPFSTIENYLYYSYYSVPFWTSSPYRGDTNVTGIGVDLNYRSLTNSNIRVIYVIRPVINLKADTLITTGNGTIGSPYTVQ